MSGKKKQRPPRGPAPGVQFVTAGPAPVVYCDGDPWKFGFDHQNAKARLEQLVRDHVLSQARLMGESDLREIREDVMNGRYLTFEVGWSRVINSPVGSQLYVLSLLLEHQPTATLKDVSRLLVESREEVEDALAVITPDFYSAVAEQWAIEKQVDRTKAAAFAKEAGAQAMRWIKDMQESRRPTPIPAQPEPETERVDTTNFESGMAEAPDSAIG